MTGKVLHKEKGEERWYCQVLRRHKQTHDLLKIKFWSLSHDSAVLSQLDSSSMIVFPKLALWEIKSNARMCYE